MQGKQALLDGGRELAALYANDPLTATLLDRIIGAVNLAATNSGVSPIGEYPSPSPIDNLNISAAGETVQATIQHSGALERSVRYFLEADNSPAFPRPLVHDLGSSRSPMPFALPSLDSNGKQLSWYFRAYAQYPGSKPSVPTVLGGVNNPTAIRLKGSTSLTPLLSTGSGTSSSTGMQGGWGLGKTQKSSNAVLRTGKMQAGPPTARAIYGPVGVAHTMDSIPNGPTTYFKVAAVDPASGTITTNSIESNSVTGSASVSAITAITITTTGVIASISGLVIPTAFSYARIAVCGAIASTNASSSGWAIDLYNVASVKLFGWDYQAFSLAEINSSIYKPFAFHFLDLTGSSGYQFNVSTNTGGTVSLIPVYMSVEIMKR